MVTKVALFIVHVFIFNISSILELLYLSVFLFFLSKIDEDFIAMYQANYGFTATGEHDPNVNVEAETPPEKADSSSGNKNIEQKPKNENNKLDSTGKKRKAEEKAEWFDIDPKKNNNVYVSGLPDTTTEEEFVELMSKCGIIMEDDKGME